MLYCNLYNVKHVTNNYLRTIDYCHHLVDVILNKNVSNIAAILYSSRESFTSYISKKLI